MCVTKSVEYENYFFSFIVSGDNAAHCAVCSPFPKRKSVAEMLYRKGANLNDKNKDFLTPLHSAVDKSHYDVIDVLLKLRAKVRIFINLEMFTESVFFKFILC